MGKKRKRKKNPLYDQLVPLRCVCNSYDKVFLDANALMGWRPFNGKSVTSVRNESRSTKTLISALNRGVNFHITSTVRDEFLALESREYLRSMGEVGKDLWEAKLKLIEMLENNSLVVDDSTVPLCHFSLREDNRHSSSFSKSFHGADSPLLCLGYSFAKRGEHVALFTSDSKMISSWQEGINKNILPRYGVGPDNLSIFVKRKPNCDSQRFGPLTKYH